MGEMSRRDRGVRETKSSVLRDTLLQNSIIFRGNGSCFRVLDTISPTLEGF